MENVGDEKVALQRFRDGGKRDRSYSVFEVPRVYEWRAKVMNKRLSSYLLFLLVVVLACTRPGSFPPGRAYNLLMCYPSVLLFTSVPV